MIERMYIGTKICKNTSVDSQDAGAGAQTWKVRWKNQRDMGGSILHIGMQPALMMDNSCWSGGHTGWSSQCHWWI